MLLELGKAISFFASILSFYPVAISAFFEPGARWEERLELLLPKLALAALLCLFSGLLFIWPARSNPERHTSLASTLPIRLLFWAAAGVTLLFFASWYFVCGAPGCGILGHSCGCSGGID
jgi:hypothetical protein